MFDILSKFGFIIWLLFLVFLRFLSIILYVLQHLRQEVRVQPRVIQCLAFSFEALNKVFTIHALINQSLSINHSSEVIFKQLGHNRYLRYVKEVPILNYDVFRFNYPIDIAYA